MEQQWGWRPPADNVNQEALIRTLSDSPTGPPLQPWQQTATSVFDTVMDAFLGAIGVPLNDSTSSRVGELVSAAMPLLGGVKALRGAKTAATEAGALSRVPNPIQAYHGSPHDFDQFSLSKIGTGEGAQAYGHGLYFADAPAVAEGYKRAGGLPPEISDINKRLSELSKIMDAEEAAPGRMRNYKSDIGRKASAEYDALQDRRAELAKGRMYEVNIHADPDSLLDWDTPLSGQSAKVRGVLTGEASYRGQHTAPMKDSGAPLHDLTGGGTVYPDDVYSHKGAQYYGTGDPEDAALFQKLRNLRGKPDEMVKVWRAVPDDVPTGRAIQHGDWVTISRKYAQDHGESALGGKYKIIDSKVPAKALFTNGDSPYEFGLDRSVLGQISPPSATGREAYDRFAQGAPGGKDSASYFLDQSGIPGIKYLDADSRNAALEPYFNLVRKSDGMTVRQVMANGKSLPEAQKLAATGEFELRGPIDKRSRNYVIFDDKLIEIVKKYGIAGAVSAGLLSQAQAQQMAQQGY